LLIGSIMPHHALCETALRTQNLWISQPSRLQTFLPSQVLRQSPDDTQVRSTIDPSPTQERFTLSLFQFRYIVTQSFTGTGASSICSLPSGANILDQKNVVQEAHGQDPALCHRRRCRARVHHPPAQEGTFSPTMSNNIPSGVTYYGPGDSRQRTES
jgi:hypothetical protein